MNHASVHSPTKQKITSYQAFTLVHSAIFSVGVLSLPHDISTKTGREGLWILFLSGLFVWLIIYILSKLSQRFPQETIVEYAPRILGSSKRPWIGKAINIPIMVLLGVFWLVSVAAVARLFTETVAVGLLPNTPIEATLLSLIVISALAANAKPVLLARLNELLFIFPLIPVLFWIVGAFSQGQVTHMLPLFEADWRQVMRGILVTSFAFSGYGVILMFGGYYEKPEHTFRIHTLVIASITLLYWLAFMSSLSIFGADELTHISYPIIELVKVTENPILVVERFESALLSIMMTAGFMAMTNTFAALVLMMKIYFKLDDKKAKWIPWWFVPLIYGIALFPKNVQQVAEFTSQLGLISVIISAVLPLFLLLIAILRKKKGGESSEMSHSP